MVYLDYNVKYTLTILVILILRVLYRVGVICDALVRVKNDSGTVLGGLTS